MNNIKTDQVSIYGIRHHGPGSAYSLKQALIEQKPDIILVEGPPEAGSILHFAKEPDMAPPVAILLYAPDDPRQGAYYPFAEFSPEWQAFQYGFQHTLPIQLIDLPQSNMLAMGSRSPLPTHPDSQETEGETTPENLLEVSSFDTRDPLAWIADAAGYRDSERWWEHMIEQRQSAVDLFNAVIELMNALRTEFEQVESSQIHLPHGSHRLELQREAHMRWSIHNAIHEGYKNIAVVCGAWHTPALLHDYNPERDGGLLKDLPSIQIAAAWVPWSYGRLSLDSGYGAGIESPGYYEALWQARCQNLSPTDTTIHWISKVSHLLRHEDLDASSAEIIDAVRLAKSLAALRDRPIPGLLELNEACEAVFSFGDQLPMLLIHQKLTISDRLGQVPPSVPVTPLQADLRENQKRLRFLPSAVRKEVDLDLRKPSSLERSHLLHRLDILQIHWGTKVDVGQKSGTFHEIWQLQWMPELAVDVVAASIWGTSVAGASEAYIRHHAALSKELPALSNYISKALLADLPGTIPDLMDIFDNRAAETSDIGQLMQALPTLSNTLRYGNVRQTDSGMISKVIDSLFTRICIGLPGACTSVNDDSALLMYERINETHQAVQILQNTDHLSSWQEVLLRLANQNGLHGLIAGRATRLLLDMSHIDTNETARRLRLGLSTTAQPEQAGAWVEGFLKDSGMVLIHAVQLWQIIDQWVSTVDPATFTRLLPLLRRTFSSFTTPERRQLGERVRQFSEKERLLAEAFMDFDLEQAEKVLPVLAQIFGAPTK